MLRSRSSLTASHAVLAAFTALALIGAAPAFASGDSADQPVASSHDDAKAQVPTPPGDTATADPAKDSATAKSKPAAPAAGEQASEDKDTEDQDASDQDAAKQTDEKAPAAAGDVAPSAAPEAAAPAKDTPVKTVAAAPGDATSNPGKDSDHEIAKQSWSFDGIFGTYDRASLQRGFQVYKEVCSACHSMNLVSYRNLADLGYNEAEIKAIAADVQIHDGPNDEGEMFDRPGKPSDHFKAPFPNVQAAKAANNGAMPPDMSLLAKAREGGADYIYAILTGFGPAPADKTLLPGQYWNEAMNGHIIAMPPPLTDGRVHYGDNSPESVQQYARDVAQFLTWAAEPHMEERKKIGLRVFLFMLVFAGVMYGVKRKIWSDVH